MYDTQFLYIMRIQSLISCLLLILLQAHTLPVSMVYLHAWFMERLLHYFAYVILSCLL